MTSQMPARRNISAIAGDPITWSVEFTGVDENGDPVAIEITDPTVTILTGLGSPYDGAAQPTVTLDGTTVTASLDAEDAATLWNDAGGTTPARRLRWSIAATVDGEGPWELVAGRLVLHPVGMAGQTRAGSKTVDIAVGDSTLRATIVLGGGGVGSLPSASTSARGLVELATTGETTTGTDTSRAVTPAGVKAAIEALIAGAPGTLDTLDEIAAALADDANLAATITTALAGKQPLDSDLTAIAALATTSYGRSLLTTADVDALATAIATRTALSSRYQPLDSDLTDIAALTTTSYGRGLLTTASASALAADSAFAGSYAPLAAAVPLVPAMYYGPPGGSVTTNIPPESTVRGLPMVVARSTTLVRIGLEVTVVGTSGAVIRLGIYSFDPIADTLTLLVDAGTISGTSATYQEITISQAVTAGQIIIPTATVQGAAGTPPTVRAVTPTSGLMAQFGVTASATAAAFSAFAYSRGGITAALPAAEASVVAAGFVTTSPAARVIVRTA